jgi:hypothetical protein
MITNANIAANVKAQAEATHAAFPQYKGHWDGWVLVEVTKNIKTKLGQAFRKGEKSIAMRETDGELAGCWAVYSVSNKVDTIVNAKHVKVLG